MGKPNPGSKKQLTWTRLPQGFKNSPTPFRRALATNLAKFPGQEFNCVLLQYINDLLLASMTQAQCLQGTKVLLSLLMEAGYRVTKKKRQVKYLGFSIMLGQWMLGTERKQAVCTIPTPTTCGKVHKFLGAAGFCRDMDPWIFRLSQTPI